MQIWRPTLKKLIDELEGLRDKVGDDSLITVHGMDCVSITVSNNEVELLGLNAHSKSELKRVVVQRGDDVC